MNKSEISNEFNFDYELDISQNKRDKTQHNFSKEGIAFQDFMNVGDKTMKSQNKQGNTSDILRKEHDSNYSRNIMDCMTQHSIKGKKANVSILQNNAMQTSFAPSLQQATSPKFAQKLDLLDNPNEKSKKEFTLRRVQTTKQKISSPQIIVLQSNRDLTKQLALNSFKKRPIAADKQLQEQYLQTQKQLRYYQDVIQRMIYESKKMEEQTQDLMNGFDPQNYQYQMEQYGREIMDINKQIQEEKNLEAHLNKMVKQLDEEYDGLVNSIRTSSFPRPTLVKDEAKAIIDQINSIKAEFQVLQRDDGSLNLSSTLVQNPINFDRKNTFGGTSKSECQAGINRIKDIYLQNKNSNDPRFLYNLKMACMRDEWSLYSNGQLQISISYKQCPKINIRIGNKTIKDLQKFTLKQDNCAKLQGQTISAKSYIVHEIQVKQQMMDLLFIKCEISYVLQTGKVCITLFVPVGLINFGEFSPITEKQFNADAKRSNFEYYGNYKPIDKKIINGIEEIGIYMPNLIIDRQGQNCFGLYISPFNDSTLVLIKQKGEMMLMSTKEQFWPILRLIQFIFTV